MIVKRFSDSYGFIPTPTHIMTRTKWLKKCMLGKKMLTTKINFKLGEQYVVFEEGYKTEVTDSSQTKVILNSNGRPYQNNSTFIIISVI